MRSSIGLLTLVFLVACGGGDDAAPAAEMDAMPAAPTLADFAGTWQTVAMLEGTPEPVPAVLMGSPDGMRWTMTLEDRDPLAMTVSMSGDSLISETEPYESVLRDGVMVRIRTAAVLREGRMVGTFLATYMTPDGNQVIPGTIEGTRAGGM
jgi:hypothetical protein